MTCPSLLWCTQYLFTNRYIIKIRHSTPSVRGLLWRFHSSAGFGLAGTTVRRCNKTKEGTHKESGHAARRTHWKCQPLALTQTDRPCFGKHYAATAHYRFHHSDWTARIGDLSGRTPLAQAPGTRDVSGIPRLPRRAGMEKLRKYARLGRRVGVVGGWFNSGGSAV